MISTAKALEVACLGELRVQTPATIPERSTGVDVSERRRDLCRVQRAASE